MPISALWGSGGVKRVLRGVATTNAAGNYFVDVTIPAVNVGKSVLSICNQSMYVYDGMSTSDSCSVELIDDVTLRVKGRVQGGSNNTGKTVHWQLVEY